MVAKIISGKDIGGVLRYNEHKVGEGRARLVLAGGFAGDIGGFNTPQKIQRFQHLTMLNGRVKTNAIHISLNFDPSEKPGDGTLQRIAMDYMERIGFGDQPFLVYRHLDAAHPHIHIATVNIRPDGSRIDIHNIGRTLSEQARKEIERKYNLVRAEGREERQGQGIAAADPQKAAYGRSPTKHAITNVVHAVTNNYRFTSVAEFNAALGQFNVTADRGSEGTRMHQRGGLQYWITDDRGDKTGVPIKASSIYGKPTLANLEKRFTHNAEKRAPYRDHLKQRLGEVMDSHSRFTRSTLVEGLARQGIHAVFRESGQGQLYGITYVDNIHKTVFNGSDLGKAYTAKAIAAKLGSQDIPTGATTTKRAGPQLQALRQRTYLRPAHARKDHLQQALAKRQPPAIDGNRDLLSMLLARTAPEYGPYIPRRKKRKRRKMPSDAGQGKGL